jgi:hypothetical protein
MPNNRKATRSRRKQVVYSQPQWILVGSYLSPKGQRLFNIARRTDAKELIERQFSKNRYRLNPDAHVVKIINHYV